MIASWRIRSPSKFSLISAINDVNKMVEDNRKSQAMGMFGDLNPFGMK